MADPPAAEPLLFGSQYAQVVADILRNMEELDEKVAETNEFYFFGSLEIWHADGWRLGIVEHVDDIWRFRFDYKDI